MNITVVYIIIFPSNDILDQRVLPTHEEAWKLLAPVLPSTQFYGTILPRHKHCVPKYQNLLLARLTLKCGTAQRRPTMKKNDDN